MKIDHFMYAVADLDQGVAWAEAMFGATPLFGGSHEGLGTRNALLALRSGAAEPDVAERSEPSSGRKPASAERIGREADPVTGCGTASDTYLEIIAPDPAQSVESGMVMEMANLSAGGLVTWAARGDLATAKGVLEEAGISSAGPVETRRHTADGGLLVWDLLFPEGGGYGMPFFIDWRESPHPASTTPAGGELAAFSISTPEAKKLGAVLGVLDLAVEVSRGEAALRVVIEGTEGPVQLVSTEESRRLHPGSRR